MIYCHLRFNNERITFSTGEKIIPGQWDTDRQRAINSKKYPLNSELNIWLDKIETEIKSMFRGFHLDGVSPTSDLVRNKINERLFKKTSTRIPNLIEFVETYIEESSKIKNINTVRTYITTFRHLKSYCKSKDIRLDYSSINLTFYNSFIDYLTHDLSLSQNTIGKHIQVFKTFMNEATERGYNKKLDFRSRRFKRITEPVESIYLNLEELRKIEDLDLSERPSLERVRDLFLIGCFTGLRYSDFIQIKPENIREEEGAKYLEM